MSHSAPKRAVAPNTIDVGVELDIPAKICFISHNSPAKGHQVWTIGLNKPKYYGKEFQEVKLV